MKQINKYIIIIFVFTISIFYGCNSKSNKAGDVSFNDMPEKTIDTLAELAKHIDEYDYISGFFYGYAWVKKNGKIGVIDKAGILVVDCQFDDLHSFKSPYVVCSKNERYGIIDYEGNIVCDFIYDAISLCKDSIHNVLAIVESNGRQGIINYEGGVVVPCKYEELFYDDGLFMIKKNGKFGWIDTMGNEVIEAKYISVDGFCEGFAIVQQEDGRCGFIDKNGNQITEFKYDKDWIHPFHEGVAVAKEFGDEGRGTIIDCKGNEYHLSRGVFFTEWQFSEGLIPVTNLEINKDGYVNTHGNLVIDYKYSGAENFSEGLARVSYDGGSFGFIDKRGDIVVPFIYGRDGTKSFHEGIARVADSRYGTMDGYDNVGYIDKEGNTIISYSDYERVGRFHEGLVCVMKNGKYGFCNLNGQLVIPCIYDNGSSGIQGPYFSSGLAKVKKDGKVGFVDKQGNSTFDKMKE